jgi:ribosomal protein S6--L-glutamate ligase
MPPPLILGWQEWVSLPDLGLPALKAKIDTGARTSALHTHLIDPFGTAKHPMVRFTVRPNPHRTDLEIEASAPVIDRREVISSNGERELRFVIATRLSMGGSEWPIEITLTNRERMTYRMLIGRQGIRPNVLVDPDTSFRQPKLSYTVYRGA